MIEKATPTSGCARHLQRRREERELRARCDARSSRARCSAVNWTARWYRPAARRARTRARTRVRIPGKGPRMNAVRMQLRVNGEEQEILFHPYKTLLEVLREDLNLTGTKHGCELGECGACAVLVDGQPLLSCLVLAVECEGKAIETVEGLARGAALHPLQAAFADLGGAQCGYCTPGILMTAKALLDQEHRAARHPRGDLGKLCRCTGYQRSTFHEERQTVHRDDGEREAKDPLRGAGQAAPPRGRARQGHGADQVRGRHRARAHAAHEAAALAASARRDRVHRCRASRGASRRAPGADRQGLPYHLRHPAGVATNTRAANERVRYVGDPVAAVVAREQDGVGGLRMIGVKYRPLKTISNSEEALATPEPRNPEHG